MEIRNQCCTYEQAQKLAALGVNAPSFFYWAAGNMPYILLAANAAGIEITYPAFTVAELGEMLPDGCDVSTRNGILAQFSTIRIAPSAQRLVGDKRFSCGADYHELMGTINGYDAYRFWQSKEGITEAEARAAMLIYLLENKYTTAEQVNNRLIAA